jgi:multiple sugar transport system permease protein
LVFVMTRGGPGNASSVLAHFMYIEAFNNYRMGYGAAIAWVMFLIALILTLLLFGSAKYWVYYGGEKQ